jgi:heptosyltransferase-2
MNEELVRRATPAELHAPVVANRVLVKEVNWLGDLVMSLPALRGVRAAFPLSKLAVLVREELTGFFDGLTWVDEVISHRSARGIGKLSGAYTAVRQIKSGGFDLAVLFPDSFESALWVTLAGVPTRAGYATDGRGWMLTHRATPAGDALEGHQSQYWLNLIRETLNVAPIESVLQHQLEVNEKHQLRMRLWLAENRREPGAPLIAMAPAAAFGPAKEWPLVRYASLVDLVADHLGAECVIVGTAKERIKCEQLAATSQSGALVAAGRIGLGELIALLSLCDGFVGNDSGAMHLAAALGIPTIGLFGSTNPLRTGPLGHCAAIIQHPVPCSPCLEQTCRFGHYECWRAITPEEVLDKLAALMINRHDAHAAG